MSSRTEKLTGGEATAWKRVLASATSESLRREYDLTMPEAKRAAAQGGITARTARIIRGVKAVSIMRGAWVLDDTKHMKKRAQ